MVVVKGIGVKGKFFFFIKGEIMARLHADGNDLVEMETSLKTRRIAGQKS